MPEPNVLHVDAILSNLSVKYRNEDMIWPLIMPVIKVGKRSDKYFVYNKADSYKLADDALGPKSLPNEVDWGTTQENYSVTDHGLGDWLPQETIDNSDNPLAPEADTNEFINMCLDVAQEKRVVDKIFNQATYPSGNKTQLSGTSRWGNAADNPIGNVLTAVEACFVRANTLVFGQEAWTKFRALPEILDAVKATSRYQGSPGGLATAAEVAALFEVKNVLVGRARYITAKEGQTPAYARLWGKHMAALHVAPGPPGIKSITFGGTFAETLRQTQRDFDPKRGVKGAHYIKVAWNSDEKIIAPDLGYFIQDAID
jgi:hypothetical protein